MKAMKKNKFEMRQDWNTDVPLETLLRNEVQKSRKLRQKIGELESEIQHLNSVIQLRDLAISEFKKWQQQIAKMKIREWVSKAKNLEDDPAELERINIVKNAVKNFDMFESMLRKLERSYKMFQDNMDKLKETENDREEASITKGQQQ